MATEKWEYHRFHDDAFLLVCRVSCPPSELDKHPAVRAFNEAVAGAREGTPPSGKPNNPKHWTGQFRLGSLKFEIPAIYAFHKFFGLVCDPIEDGGRKDWHDPDNMRTIVDALNAGWD